MSMQRSDVEYVNDVPASGASKQFVENYAGQVREVLALDDDDDLKQAVERLGGRLRFIEFDEWTEESGSIFVHDKHDFDIVLPLYTSPLRDRFTIAHELGHYFLHSRQGEIPLIATRRGTGRVEWEANWFAAGMLMPERQFKASCKRHGDDTDRVAADFGVSLEAAKTRRASLGV